MKELMLVVHPIIAKSLVEGHTLIGPFKTVPHHNFKGWVNVYVQKTSNVIYGVKKGLAFIGTTRIPQSEWHKYPNILNGKVIGRFWYDEKRKPMEMTDFSNYEIQKKIIGFMMEAKRWEMFDEYKILDDFGLKKAPSNGWCYIRKD